MKIERLPESIYNENFGDFLRCEDKWEEIEEEVAFKFIESAYKLSLECEKNPRDFLKEESARKMLKEGQVIRLPFFFIREKNSKDKCPLCGCSFNYELGSISRRDNNTTICSNCGMKEALEDFNNFR